MPQGFSRPLLIAATVGLAAAVVGPIAPAQAQFFFGFGAPQQIQTARGAVQLAPGWHVATTPVRTQGGYRVAVRSDTGEQRQMLIGANGALSYSRAPDPRPLQRASRLQDRKQTGVRLANIPPRTKQAITPDPHAAPRVEGDGPQRAKPHGIAGPAAKGRANIPSICPSRPPDARLCEWRTHKSSGLITPIVRAPLATPHPRNGFDP